jgi:hypothetical protein
VDYAGNPFPEHVVDQLTAAKDAAIGLIESGSLGTADARYTVILSGHANPGHVPAPEGGWANDCVTISIYQFDNVAR